MGFFFGSRVERAVGSSSGDASEEGAWSSLEQLGEERRNRIPFLPRAW